MREGETLASLWAWVVDLAAASRSDVPLAVHSRSGDREGWEWSKELSPAKIHAQAIRGLPFSKPFLRRVDHELPRSLRQALGTCRASREADGDSYLARHAQWRVVRSVIRGGITDAEDCRRRLRMAPWTFNVAAEGGIRALRSALERA